MNPDDFEKRLQRQPLREIPSECREDILRAATLPAHSSFVIRHSLRSTLTSRLSSILWPQPKAWAGLAAVWVLIFALHLGARDRSPQLAKSSGSSAPELMMGLKDQEKILAELMSNNEPRESEKPRRFPATPHSERRRSTPMI